MTTLAESHAWCKSLSRRTAGNFYFSFLTLPADRFRDMCALYAFMRISDDLGDETSVPLAERAARLLEWRADLERVLRGEAVDHPVYPALMQMMERHRVPPEYLFAVIDGVRMDLEPSGFETVDDLLHYCYHVAGAVGLCCIHVWGFHDDRAIDLAIDGFVYLLQPDGHILVFSAGAFEREIVPAEVTPPLVTPASFFVTGEDPESGSIFPATCTMSPPSKIRTTCAIASTSRMCERNWLPKPCPSEAPFTSPAMSTNCTAAGIVFAERDSAESACRRVSGTSTIPTDGSIVQNG